MKISTNRRPRGFSLIEVLIAVVIMSLGLLALAALQIGVVRASSEAKSQSMAINLARDKLEDLVTYKLLDEPTNTCAVANDSYQCITGSGSAQTIAQGGLSFSRTWVVNRCVLDGAATTFTCSTANLTAANAGTTPRNEFKVVDVFVSWGDASGQTQTVSVKDSVSAYSPADIALIQSKSVKLTPRFARERIYDPAAEAGVIPIAVGGGTESAATNPKPEVVVGTAVVETRFNVLTYSGLTGGAVDAQSRVETAMVGCTCDFSARPSNQNAATNTSRAKRPTYWNGYRYVAPDDATYVPMSGAANVTQSARCDICCRDHFDPATLDPALPKFSPYLVTHNHYNSAAAGAPAIAYPNVYREACRVIRVDGVFRVAADLNNDYFGLLATKDLSNASYYASSSIPDAAATTNYQNFVVGYLNARYTNQGTVANYNDLTSVNTTTLETTNNINLPASVTIGSAFNGRLVNTAITLVTRSSVATVVTHSATYTDLNGNALPATDAFQNGDRVNFYNISGTTQLNGGSYIVANAAPATFTLKQLAANGSLVDVDSSAWTAYASGGTAYVNHGKWLHARGLFVDNLEQDALDAIAAAKVDSACTASSAALSTCILKLLPFTSINLTEIAGFTSADSNQIGVTNNNYSESLTVNDPVRGEVTFVPGATDGQTFNANTASRKKNTSLLDLGPDSSDAISPTDAATWPDAQPFLISNAVPQTKPGGGHFYVQTSLAGKTGYGPNYRTGTQGTNSCISVASPVSPFLSRYDCNVTNQQSTTVAPVDAVNSGLTTPGSVSVVLVGYNYKVSTANITSGSVSCTDSAGLNPRTVSPSNGDPLSRDTCANYDISTVVQAPARGLVGTPTYTGQGTLAEQATITFADLQASDIVNVTFVSPVATFTPTACTYSCSTTNCSGGGNKFNAKQVCP